MNKFNLPYSEAKRIDNQLLENVQYMNESLSYASHQSTRSFVPHKLLKIATISSTSVLKSGTNFVWVVDNMTIFMGYLESYYDLIFGKNFTFEIKLIFKYYNK